MRAPGASPAPSGLAAPARFDFREVLDAAFATLLPMLVLAAFAYAVAPLVDRMTLSWFLRDMDIRADLIANAIHDPLKEQLAAGKKAKISDFFLRISQDERLYAIGYCATPQSER